MQQHVLPTAEAKLNHILFEQFDVSLRLDPLPVHVRPIRRSEVDDVRSDSATQPAIGACKVNQSKLQSGVLLRAGRVIDRYIGDSTISTEQESTLPMQVQHRQSRFAFKRIKSPMFLRLSCLRRLVVFHHDATEGVGVLGEFAGQGETRFFLLFLRRRRSSGRTVSAPVFFVVSPRRSTLQPTTIIAATVLSLFAKTVVAASTRWRRVVDRCPLMDRRTTGTATPVVAVVSAIAVTVRKRFFRFFFHTSQVKFDDIGFA